MNDYPDTLTMNQRHMNVLLFIHPAAELKTVSCTTFYTQDGGGWSDDVCDSLARQLSDEFSSCDATAQRLL